MAERDDLINALSRKYADMHSAGDLRNRLAGDPSIPPPTPYESAMERARGLQSGMLGADPVEMAMGLLGPNARGAGALARSALPMDMASRIARAREGGFNTDRPLYHGSNKYPFEAFDPATTHPNSEIAGHQFTPDIAEAATYGNPRPYYLRQQKPLHVDAGWNPIHPEDAEALKRAGIDLAGSAYTGKQGVGQKLTDQLRALGYDGLEMAEGMGGKGVPNVIAFNPADIRRTNAAFDPAMRDSPNLLASIAGAAALPGLAFLGRQRDGDQ